MIVTEKPDEPWLARRYRCSGRWGCGAVVTMEHEDRHQIGMFRVTPQLDGSFTIRTRCRHCGRPTALFTEVEEGDDA